MGLGDGRIMAIAALDKIGRARVIARPDIVQHLHTLADSPETQGDLRQKTKELLRKLKK
jgi:hypothetical protein